MLEIEGAPFSVLEYQEYDEDDDAIGRYALLKLSKEQFDKFNNLLRPGSVQIRRRGIDEQPLIVRYGAAMYWSEHEEDGELYYKQIVRFFPHDFPPSGINIASGARQDAISLMVQALTVRFEALLDSLSQQGIITEESKSALLGENWRTLLNTDRTNEICLQINKVYDASEYL